MGYDECPYSSCCYSHLLCKTAPTSTVTETKKVTVTVTVPKVDVHKYFTTTLYHKPPVNDGRELKLNGFHVNAIGALVLTYTN